MTKKHYSDEFKADAVRLYESRPEASYASLAADLGIARGSLKTWVHLARKNAAAGQSAGAADGAGVSGTIQEQLAQAQADLERVRARNQALASENDKLTEERDILRKATKYFAAETNW